MTRDEIYDHLAQVYLGKRKGADQKKKKQLNAWLVINIVIAGIIFASIFYGLTAFFAQRGSTLTSNIYYSLNNGPIRISYDLNEPFPPITTFSLTIPKMDLSKYSDIRFSLRANEDGSPGIVKILIKNDRNESASYYLRGVDEDWQQVHIPLDEFKQITDWSSVTDVSFILESWNVTKKKGTVLIDNLCFATKS